MKNLLYIMLYFMYFIFICLTILHLEDTNAGSNTHVRIAIIDDGYDPLYAAGINAEPLKICNTGSFDFNSNTPGVHHSGRHGTIVGSIIAERLKNVDYCAVIYKVFESKISDSKPSDIIKALLDAQQQGFAAINMSYNGSTGFILEEALMRNLGAHGVKMFIAAGNNNHNLNENCDAFPSCYLNVDNTVVVGALQNNGLKCHQSNYGSIVNVTAKGTLEDKFAEDDDQCATSFATPRVLSDYILSLAVKLQKQTTITPPSLTPGPRTTSIKVMTQI